MGHLSKRKMSIYKRSKTLKESTVMIQVLPLSMSVVKSALNLNLQSKTCEPAVPSINASAELPCLFHQFSACGFIYFQRPAYRFIKAFYSQLLGSGALSSHFSCGKENRLCGQEDCKDTPASL